LANYYFQEKDYHEALNYYNVIAAKYDEDKMMLSSAIAGAATCKEIDGNRGEAGRLYLQAARTFPDELWAPDYLLRAGASFVAAGDTASARIAYSEIDSSYGKSMQANKARRSLAEINY
jgi:TolA-binding protein